MNNDLTGKMALVTGGSRGIGRAAPVALAKAGAEVAVNFIHREPEARAVCREVEAVGRRALAVKADVSKAAEAARLVGTWRTMESVELLGRVCLTQVALSAHLISSVKRTRS